MRRTFGLCIALCIGLASACVHVDVSVTSQDNNPLGPPFPSNYKLPISIKELKKRHAGINAGINKECLPRKFLAIDREKQQTAAWCWAASARMVMEYRNKSEQPPKPTALQCDIVRNVFGLWTEGTNCCEREVTRDFINAPLTCVQGGWPDWVLDKYHFNHEWVDGALDDWKALKGEICTTGPFISVVEWSGGGKHAFIVAGYKDSDSESSEKLVTLYDPTTDDFEDVTFEEFLGKSSEGSDRLYGSTHNRNYVQIWPNPKDRQ
jgi:hypothetical protein